MGQLTTILTVDGDMDVLELADQGESNWERRQRKQAQRSPFWHKVECAAMWVAGIALWCWIVFGGLARGLAK